MDLSSHAYRSNKLQIENNAPLSLWASQQMYKKSENFIDLSR